jgi:hypothetical protein
MKLLFILLLVIPFGIKAQSYRLKSYESRIDLYKDDGTYDTATDTWANSDLIITLDMDNNKFHIYGRKETDVDIIRYHTPMKQSNGDCYMLMDGVDQDGKECGIKSIIYQNSNSKHVGTFILLYPRNFAILFHMQREE